MTTLAERLRSAYQAFVAAPPGRPATTVRESAGATSDAEPGWTRLTADGLAASERDLTPLSQDRMQRLAEHLWQSNLIANRVIEIPLAYLLAEGVRLECQDPDHQALLDKFWADPINDFAVKLYPRARALSMYGEQCYTVHVNEVSGAVRLGYVAPQRIGQVVMDPDNPEQAIGVVTKRNAKGEYRRYRTIVLGPDEELFTRRTAQIRAGFADGDVFLFTVNRLADGTRGRSDLIGQMDWLDAYDDFLFGETDRTRYLRSFVWDLNIKNGTAEDVKDRAANFTPPAPNSAFVHNDGEELNPKSPSLQAADTSESARLIRNHVLGGATMPEHWFGGGGDVNRAAASEMGEPTFKLYTARQTQLKLMLEQIGRYVLMQQPAAKPEWGTPAWTVTARFPELVSKDVTKFAAAMREVAAAALLLVGQHLLTRERALRLVADVAQRFGQEIDAEAELEGAAKERDEAAARAHDRDAFAMPGDDTPPMNNQVGQAGQSGRAGGARAARDDG